MSKYQQSSLFIKRLGLEYPIIQSPMAGISTIKLASVISSNGGLGSIPLASVDARKQSGIDSIDKQLNEFKSLAKTNVVNVNFFCHNHEEQQTPTATQTENWHKLLGKASPSINKDIPSLQKSNISLTEVESNHPELFCTITREIGTMQAEGSKFPFWIPIPKGH